MQGHNGNGSFKTRWKEHFESQVGQLQAQVVLKEELLGEWTFEKLTWTGIGQDWKTRKKGNKEIKK